MKKPDSQVAYNLQLSLGRLPCNVHGNRSDSLSLFFGWLLGFEPTIPCLFLYRSQDSTPPPPWFQSFSSRPHLFSSLVLFSLLPLFLFYLFFSFSMTFACIFLGWLTSLPLSSPLPLPAHGIAGAAGAAIDSEAELWRRLVPLEKYPVANAVADWLV